MFCFQISFSSFSFCCYCSFRCHFSTPHSNLRCPGYALAESYRRKEKQNSQIVITLPFYNRFFYGPNIPLLNHITSFGSQYYNVFLLAVIIIHDGVNDCNKDKTKEGALEIVKSSFCVGLRSVQILPVCFFFTCSNAVYSRLVPSGIVSRAFWRLHVSTHLALVACFPVCLVLVTNISTLCTNCIFSRTQH